MNRNMEAITWALHARGISPTAFRLLIQLCSFVNSTRDDFDVWPSHALLAERVEISVSGIKRHLKELVDAKYILVRAGERDDGAKTSNRYAIAVRTLHQMPDGARVKLTPTIGQSDLGPQVRGERGDRSLVTYANEPLEREPLKERTNPPLPAEGAPPQPSDLFGQEVDLPKIELHDRVAEAWKALVHRKPGIGGVSVLSPARKQKIAARAADVKKAEPDPWRAWNRVLQAIEANTYLCGEDPPGRNYTEPKRLTLDEVLRPAEFLKIFDGGYRANRTAQTHDLNTGRRYGPAEQATRTAIAGIRASHGEHRDGEHGGSGAQADGSGGGRPRRLRSAFDQYRDDASG